MNSSPNHCKQSLDFNIFDLTSLSKVIVEIIIVQLRDQYGSLKYLLTRNIDVPNRFLNAELITNGEQVRSMN